MPKKPSSIRVMIRENTGHQLFGQYYRLVIWVLRFRSRRLCLSSRNRTGGMGNFIHLFPLSVYKERIELPSAYKAELIAAILEMEKQNRGKPDDAAWLGDTQGHEFLFQVDIFKRMYFEISKKIQEYVHAMGVNEKLIEFFFQRSWASVTRKGERIHEHCHEQSNISFAYYLAKPKNAGGISFITYNHPNEFSNGIFTPSKSQLGFIQEPSMLTWNIVNLEPQEDEIVIFPSKTLHATIPNECDQPRISISADVTTMLRDSTGHETMMPHHSQWRSLDEFQRNG